MSLPAIGQQPLPAAIGQLTASQAEMSGMADMDELRRPELSHSRKPGRRVLY